MESEIAEKRIVHKQSLGQPAQRPSPTPRAKQSSESRQQPGQVRHRPEERSKTASRSVRQRRIVSLRRSAPHRVRIIVRHVHPLWIGRLNFNRALLPLRLCVDRVLRCAPEPPILPRLSPQILDRIHYVRLLPQKRIPQVGGPPDIAIQQRHHIRKRHQRLHARVPILLPRRLHQFPVTQVSILLQPLLRLNDLQWVSARHQYLAKQRIRIKRNRRHQILQLTL